MDLVKYIMQSYKTPNKAVLKGLGASDELINYLMETPYNTNFAIAKQMAAKEEEPEVEMITITIDFNGYNYKNKEGGTYTFETPKGEPIEWSEVKTEVEEDINYDFGMGLVGFSTVMDNDSTILEDEDEGFSEDTTVYAFYMAEEGYYNIYIDLNGSDYKGKSYVRFARVADNNFPANLWYSQMHLVILPPEGKEYGGLTTTKDDTSTLINGNTYTVDNDKVFYIYWKDIESTAE